jgi:hypothetical protein
MLHGAGIFTCMTGFFWANVGKYMGQVFIYDIEVDAMKYWNSLMLHYEMQQNDQLLVYENITD